jgi:hypothetical protein
MSLFSNLLTNKPPYTPDVGRALAAAEAQRASNANQLAAQYAQASVDPRYGFVRLPSVGEQKHDLDNVVADTFNGVSRARAAAQLTRPRRTSVSDGSSRSGASSVGSGRPLTRLPERPATPLTGSILYMRCLSMYSRGSLGARLQRRVSCAM